MWFLLLKIFLALLIGVSILSLVHFRHFDTPIKLISYYVIICTVVELIAHYCAIKYSNNLIVYNIFSPIQLTLISLFYGYTLINIRKSTIIVISLANFLLAAINASFLQSPIHTLNTNFLLFESFIIISLSLYFLYHYLAASQRVSKALTPHFIVSCLLLVFWSFTFFHWLSRMAMPNVIDKHIEWLKYLLWAISLITYLGFGLVFLFYKRLQPARE